MIHKSVLLKEAIDLLKIKENGVYVDLTLGGGGHSLEILNSLEKVSLIAFDIDRKSIQEFEKKLIELGFKGNKKFRSLEAVKQFKIYNLRHKTIYLVNDNFINLKNYTDQLDIKSVDGILADLGWSSDQLGIIAGLSYDNPSDELDMRMGENQGVRAADLLNVLGRKELEKMLGTYADIYGNQSKKLVEEIIKFRKEDLFNTVEDIIKVIDKAFRTVAINRFKRNEKYSIYSKVFQALRIAVNSEFSNLDLMVNNSIKLLNKGGRMVVITFHSGEERIVKNIFTSLKENSELEFISGKFGEVEVRPSVEELRENIRSRSAKLFGVERI